MFSRKKKRRRRRKHGIYQSRLFKDDKGSFPHVNLGGSGGSPVTIPCHSDRQRTWAHPRFQKPKWPRQASPTTEIAPRAQLPLLVGGVFWGSCAFALKISQVFKIHTKPNHQCSGQADSSQGNPKEVSAAASRWKQLGAGSWPHPDRCEQNIVAPSDGCVCVCDFLRVPMLWWF